MMIIRVGWCYWLVTRNSLEWDVLVACSQRTMMPGSGSTRAGDAVGPGPGGGRAAAVTEEIKILQQ
jgi:hypothetical protein